MWHFSFVIKSLHTTVIIVAPFPITSTNRRSSLQERVCGTWACSHTNMQKIHTIMLPAGGCFLSLLHHMIILAIHQGTQIFWFCFIYSLSIYWLISTHNFWTTLHTCDPLWTNLSCTTFVTPSFPLLTGSHNSHAAAHCSRLYMACCFGWQVAGSTWKHGLWSRCYLWTLQVPICRVQCVN